VRMKLVFICSPIYKNSGIFEEQNVKIVFMGHRTVLPAVIKDGARALGRRKKFASVTS